MTAGFLSIFSRIPADVLIDGRKAGSTEEGQILVAPGTHTVVLENAHFNFKSEFTVDIKPSEVTAHTVTLPTGALVVTTEPGAEIWIEGERVGVAPLGPIAVPIGTREVVVRHASGEARQSAEIIYGRQSEITLNVATDPGPPASALPVQMPPLSAPASGPRPTLP
jgi:H2-forming N5,N10-methylenetetrahydromethanopterin dehydrogenase-like enzyme